MRKTARNTTELLAVIYTRVSTEDQAEYGYSLSQQRDDLTRLAASLGARVVEFYEDAGVSGARYLTRPGIQAALTALREGRANLLLVHSTSRLSRDREHQSVILREIEQAGAKLVVHDMPVEDSPEGSLMLGIRGDFDEYERKVFKKRSRSGKQRQAKEGLQPARTFSPYGYHIVTKEDVLTGKYPAGTVGTYQIIEDTAQWVREMFRRYARGHSLRQIALWLHDNGVETPRGARHWHAKSISDILKNPTHKGTAYYNKHETHTDENRLAEGFKRIDFSMPRPEEEWIAIDVPAIVDEETWAVCQERFGKNREQFGGNPDKRYLLVGLLKCPTCLRRMGAKNYPRAGRAYYRCREFHESTNPLGHVCNNKHYNTAEVERLVLKAIEDVLKRPEYIEAALRTFLKDAENSNEAAELERLEIAFVEVEKEERATVKAQISGVQSGADPSIYNDMLTEIAGRRGKLQLQLKQAKVRMDILQQHNDPAQEAKLLAENLSTSLRQVMATPESELTLAEKNRLLSHIIQDIVPREIEEMIKRS